MAVVGVAVDGWADGSDLLVFPTYQSTRNSYPRRYPGQVVKVV